jgi:hypothetical protein
MHTDRVMNIGDHARNRHLHAIMHRADGMGFHFETYHHGVPHEA